MTSCGTNVTSPTTALQSPRRHKSTRAAYSHSACLKSSRSFHQRAGLNGSAETGSITSLTFDPRLAAKILRARVVWALEATMMSVRADRLERKRDTRCASARRSSARSGMVRIASVVRP